MEEQAQTTAPIDDWGPPHCPKSPDGQHSPQWSTGHLERDPLQGQGLVRVTCRYCEETGKAVIFESDLEWPGQE